LFEEWQNIPQGSFKVSVSQCQGAVINADEAHKAPVTLSRFDPYVSLRFEKVAKRQYT
jgi:hypothetical protein